jgi:hypothetical protein
VKWSSCLGTLDPHLRAVHAASPAGPTSAAINSSIMNPRYRRMVIPGALVVLILIVAVAAVAKG